MRISITALSLLLFTSAFAQDSHYWSSLYGPGGFFLPGATLAYNGDSGVYYYNPALLTKSGKSAISLNAILYESQSIKIKNGAGTGLDLKSRNNASVPLMLAGNVYFRKKKISVAYALIHTPGIHYTSSQRRDSKFQVLDDSYSPGPEYFIGQYVIENRASETRAQIASGIKINKSLSAGLLIEGNIYRQYLSQDYISRALVNPGIVNFPIVATDASYVADYNHYGLRIRPGISYDRERDHFGLTISLPMINVGGNGTIVSDNVIDNLKLTPSSDPLGLLANTRQTKLKSKWKPPLSFAFGYLRDFKKSQLYFAAEYFTGVKEYNILTPRNEYFIRPDTGTNNQFTADLLKLKDVRKPVANFAVGYSHALKKQLTGYVCFRTNFTYFDESRFKDEMGIIPYTTTWNNYHFQIGANKKTSKRNFKVGIMLTYGSTKKYLQPVNYDDPNEINLLMGNPVNTKATHFTAGLMLAYVYNLE